MVSLSAVVRRGWLVGACLGVLQLTGACSGRDEGALAGSDENFRAKFNNPRGGQVAEPRLPRNPTGVSAAVGEPCDDGFDGTCESGICLHVQLAERTRGYVCSMKCVEHTECPAGWRCVQTGAAAGSDFCVPEATSKPAGGGR